MNKLMELDILGTKYEVIEQTEAENAKLEDADGLSEFYSKQLIIEKKDGSGKLDWANFQEYKNHVLRHEIMHAVFAESGLMDYYRDETLVDYLAIMYPKIKAIMDKAGL